MSRYPGVRRQRACEPAGKHRAGALVQLIATVALALSTLIAATAVSIGFARAGASDGAAALHRMIAHN